MYCDFHADITCVLHSLHKSQPLSSLMYRYTEQHIVKGLVLPALYKASDMLLGSCVTPQNEVGACHRRMLKLGHLNKPIQCLAGKKSIYTTHSQDKIQTQQQSVQTYYRFVLLYVNMISRNRPCHRFMFAVQAAFLRVQLSQSGCS